jgi:hypothetical protein
MLFKKNGLGVTLAIFLSQYIDNQCQFLKSVTPSTLDYFNISGFEANYRVGATCNISVMRCATCDIAICDFRQYKNRTSRFKSLNV